MRVGDSDAVDTYQKHGRLRSIDDLDELLDEVATRYHNGEEVVVLAGANRVVDSLNRALQTRLVDERAPDLERLIRWLDPATKTLQEHTVGGR